MKTLFYTLMLLTEKAQACPFCHTNTAEEVRAGIRAGFAEPTTVLSLILPAAVIAAVIWWMHREGSSL